MSQFDGESLYRLLPSVYRIRDAENGEPLRALLGVIEAQAMALEADVARLYDDWFIETCEEWVVPYIGDLLGVRPLIPIDAVGFTERAYIGNTLGYRRRKGTRAMLERLAQDVTGWPAVAVEAFRLLAATANANHVRRDRVGTPDIRRAADLQLVGGPFETAGHTVEVRRAEPGRGRYNIPSVCIYLFRLEAFAVRGVVAARTSGEGDDAAFFRFSQLGHDLPLFNRRRSDDLAGVDNVEASMPTPLRRLALYEDLEAYRRAIVAGDVPASPWFNNAPPFSLTLPGATAPVPPAEILICTLDPWHRPPKTVRYRDANGADVDRPISVAVDPLLGRIALANTPPAGEVTVDYHYGFSAPMGGGAYDRRRTLTPVGVRTRYEVHGGGAALQTALQAWWTAADTDALIEITDSASYTVDPAALTPVPTGGLEILDGTALELRAAGGQRPMLLPSGGTLQVALDDGGALRLGGLLVAAGLAVTSQGQTMLSLTDCTLVPGLGLTIDGKPAHPDGVSLAATSGDGHLSVELHRVVSGRIQLPDDPDGNRLIIEDTIVDDSHGPAPAITAGTLRIARSTVFGAASARVLELADESLFTGLVTIERTQTGCCRFSFVPLGSRVPRRHRCQPDSALDAAPPAQAARVEARLRPQFTSRRYGTPGYAQLGSSGPSEIATGASDGSEMGAFKRLQQPQREANLRRALDEYLRFGFEAGLFFVS